MPKLDLSQLSTADTAFTPSTQSTIVPTARSVYDLFTGGWPHRLTGLPAALRGIVARRAGQGRPAAERRDQPGPDAAHR